VNRAPVVRLLVTVVGLGAAAAAARRLRGPAAPVFLAPPTAPEGLLRPEPAAPRPGATDPGAPDHTTADHTTADHTTADHTTADLPTADLPTAEPATGPSGDPDPDPEPERRPAPAGERWVFPLDDGTCPPGHLIKAKLRSGLYHQPGMAAYERTHPDRCYAEAVDAEADGLRRAKH
jgi:hypothetical protein